MPNKDEGAIIGYRPELKYQKKPSNTNKPSEESKVDSSSFLDVYQDSNMESAILKLNTSLELVTEFLSDISSNYPMTESESNLLEQFVHELDAGSKDIPPFLENNRIQIDGFTSIELYYLLYKEQTYLKNLKHTLVSLYFGDISESELESSFQALNDKINSYSQTSFEKLNLTNFNLDSFLFYSIDSCLVDLNMTLAENINREDTFVPETVDPSFPMMVFEELNHTTDKELQFFASQIDEDYSVRCLNQYGYLRNKLFEMQQHTNHLSNESIVYEAMHYQKEKTKQVAKDFAVSLTGNVYYLQTLLSSLSRKETIRKIYRFNNK